MAWRVTLLLSILCLSAAGEVAAVEEAALPCRKPLPDIFAEASPGVLVVSAIKVDPFAVTERVSGAVGSGFVIDGDGHVLTSAHVVFGSNNIMVSNGDGAAAAAKLVGLDPIFDLAVLKVPQPPERITPLRLGDSDALRIGEDVAAIGRSFGMEKTLTRGVVSGLNRRISETTMSWLQPLIQTDAAIGPGMSGGPLLNSCGEVVGVITLMAVDGQSTGFAVPANLVRQVLPQLIEHGRVIRPWHGIYGQFVGALTLMTLGYPPLEGFLVETVEPGSPAEQIGLRGGGLPVRIGMLHFIVGGDLIVRANETPLSDVESILKMARGLKVGDRVTLSYYREGEMQQAELILTERPILPSDFARWE